MGGKNGLVFWRAGQGSKFTGGKIKLWYTFPSFYFPRCFSSSIFFQHTLTFLLIFSSYCIFLVRITFPFRWCFSIIPFFLFSWNGNLVCKQNERNFMGWWWIEKNDLGYSRHIRKKILLSSMFGRNPRVYNSGKRQWWREVSMVFQLIFSSSG